MRERLHAPTGPALALLLAASAAAAPGDRRWDRLLDRGAGAEVPVHAVQSRAHVHLALLSTGDAGRGGWSLRTLDTATGDLAGEDREDTPGFDVVGGELKVAAGVASVVTGGAGNSARGGASVVGGGLSRDVSGEFDWRAGNLSQDE